MNTTTSFLTPFEPAVPQAKEAPEDTDTLFVPTLPFHRRPTEHA